MDRIGAGLYVDSKGTLHISLPEVLRAHGFADTPENRETLGAITERMLREHWPGVPLEIFE